ncbi:TPA: hypothetical protein ACH3X1_011082 [Trebouxia sp. C0004]
MRSHLCCEQATGLKEHLNREKATNQELVQQCSSAEQNVKAMEDEVRLVKRQLSIMAKARDVARQEKEDWKSTCNSQEKMMQHVGAGLVAIQVSTRMRPPDPESVAATATVVIHAAPGYAAAAKDLLFKLDSMQAQATSLHEEWVSEKSQRIQLTERLVKQSARLSDQVMLNEANANRISILSADKEHLQAQLADVEALRIVPLYKSIDSLTADIAVRDDSILAHQGSIAALQAQIGRLEAALDVKRGKKQAYKIAFTGKVEIEKELRRQLLEVDEHSSHQGRQLERLQEHTVAMHALAPGMLILQRSLQQNHAARKMLNERLEEARAGKLHAEREHAKADALATGLQHDLELLKHQTESAIANEQKQRQVQASLQDALATKKEEARQLQADKTAALKEVSDLQQQLKEAQGSASQLAAEKAAEQKEHEQQTAQLEAQIQALDSMRYDLEQAKASLTAKLELSSAANTALEIHILEEKAKAEQAQIMMNNSSDSCSRQVSQLHKELRVSRHEGLSLQGQLDTSLENLQRKREKKRHYKVALLEETEQLQAALLHKDVRIAELNHRIDKLKQSLVSLHDIHSPQHGPRGGAATNSPLEAVMTTSAASQTQELVEQLKQEEAQLQQRMMEIDAQLQYAEQAQEALEPEAAQTLTRERGTIVRQLRGVTERSSLAASRLQVEDAASSLTALEQLYQREQAKAVQSMHDAKQRLASQLQAIQADRDKYKAESEAEHKELLQAAEAQQHLQEQISFLEEERQTLTESWKKAESARKFLQGEVAGLKGQREKLKEELQLMQDKMVALRDKPKTPPDVTF